MTRTVKQYDNAIVRVVGTLDMLAAEADALFAAGRIGEAKRDELKNVLTDCSIGLDDLGARLREAPFD